MVGWFLSIWQLMRQHQYFLINHVMFCLKVKRTISSLIHVQGNRNGERCGSHRLCDRDLRRMEQKTKTLRIHYTCQYSEIRLQWLDTPVCQTKWLLMAKLSHYVIWGNIWIVNRTFWSLISFNNKHFAVISDCHNILLSLNLKTISWCEYVNVTAVTMY